MTPISTNKGILRREFLKGLGALTTLPLISACDLKINSTDNEYWLSAAGGNNENFSLSWLQPNSNTNYLLTDFRGHGLAKHPIKPHLVFMFSRRPGNEGVMINLKTKTIEHRFTSPPHLFMEGHGCFSHDGKYLFCTESNRHTNQGIITVRETDSFKIIREISSGGIGPHEIQTISKQTVIAVANGGLIKDKKGNTINTDTMQSNVTLIDYLSDRIISTHRTESPQSSLRHIDISDDGIIAVAMQQQDYNSESITSLTQLIKKDGSSTSLNAPKELVKKLNGYVGSVRINNRYRTAAFTSPRGDIALFWNIDSDAFLGAQYFHNVCGLTVTNDEEYFVLSNSAGKIRQIKSSTLLENTKLRQHLPTHQWDNHMITAAVRNHE